MNITKKVIEELMAAGFHGSISDPTGMLFVAKLSRNSVRVIKTDSDKVFISRKALKHIVDSRGAKAEQVVRMIPLVLQNPGKIADNSLKTKNSFLFAKAFDRHYGVVLEITKTTGLSNQVVSAFLIHRKTYGKIHDISGGTAAPQ